MEPDKSREHYDLGPSAVKKQHVVVDKIMEALLKHVNLFAVEGDSLHNLITHAYITNEYVPLILNAHENGENYQYHVSEQITGGVNVWAPIK